MAIANHPITSEQGDDSSYREYLFPIVAGLIALLFFAAPWSLEHKAHVALHGLCAQRPSHSFFFGEHRLPFDARMTGIYYGFIGAGVYLATRGRHRAAGLPNWPTMAVLGLFVGAMAVDGFNSTFLDMGWRHFYEPDNRFRLVTGMMTGVTLAVAMFLLLGMVLWKKTQLNRRVVSSFWEPVLMLTLLIPGAFLFDSGREWLFVPLTILLVASAVAVFSVLMLVVAVLFKLADNTFEDFRQVQQFAVVGLLLGIALMALIGGGRFLLESLTNAPPLV